jgi:hypothetical protein
MTDTVKKPRKKKVPMVPVSNLEPDVTTPATVDETRVVSDVGKAYAFINAGKWMVMCPKCQNFIGCGLDDKTFICPVCHNINATGLQQYSSTTRSGMKQILFRNVPDIAAREQAVDDAIAAGEEYTIVFPLEAEAITKELLSRKDRYWQSWFPERPELRAKFTHGATKFGQSLDELKAEAV